MHPLEAYYLRQAGRGLNDIGIGPIYSTPPYLQRGHGIGNFFGSLFRWVKPILWSGAKALGRETMRTGGKILSEIAENRSPDVKARDIISKHVSESKQNLIGKLRGHGARKRKQSSPKRKKGAPAKKKRKTNKRIKMDIFS